MKKRIYIETSFVSYLTNPISRDLVLAAHQEISQEWWRKKRKGYLLLSSSLTHKEASEGNPECARKRIEILSEIGLVEITQEAIDFSKELIKLAIIPDKANHDALHIAIATVNHVDFLLTWNCRHIANAIIQKKIAKVAKALGHETPYICTPIELMGE